MLVATELLRARHPNDKPSSLTEIVRDLKDCQRIRDEEIPSFLNGGPFKKIEAWLARRTADTIDAFYEVFTPLKGIADIQTRGTRVVATHLVLNYLASNQALWLMALVAVFAVSFLLFLALPQTIVQFFGALNAVAIAAAAIVGHFRPKLFRSARHVLDALSLPAYAAVLILVLMWSVGWASTLQGVPARQAPMAQSPKKP